MVSVPNLIENEQDKQLNVITEFKRGNTGLYSSKKLIIRNQWEIQGTELLKQKLYSHQSQLKLMYMFRN